MFIDVEQNTDEWKRLKCGRPGASSFSKIMAKGSDKKCPDCENLHGGKGKAFSDTAKKLAMQLATQRITGKYELESISNYHTERGHIQEPIARKLYEEETFTEVLNGGVFDKGIVCVSPDGRIPNGGIEIKSVIGPVHFKNVKRQSYDPTYKWQFVGQMHYCEFEHIDFVSYCADYPEDKQLYICRIEKDQFKEEINELTERIELFEELINEYKDFILNANYRVKL